MSHVQVTAKLKTSHSLFDCTFALALHATHGPVLYFAYVTDVCNATARSTSNQTIYAAIVQYRIYVYDILILLTDRSLIE